MSEVTRDEFDRLVERVTRVEQTLGATVEIVASEVVGLRTYLDERFAAVDARFDEVDRRFDHHDRRFDHHDRRFDHQDNMLSAFAAEVQVEFDTHARRLDEHTRTLDTHTRKLDALLDHFEIDRPD
jgi:hypothetical protein